MAPAECLNPPVTETDSQTENKTDRHSEVQADREQTQRKKVRHEERQADKETDSGKMTRLTNSFASQSLRASPREDFDPTLETNICVMSKFLNKEMQNAFQVSSIFNRRLCKLAPLKKENK